MVLKPLRALARRLEAQANPRAMATLMQFAHRASITLNSALKREFVPHPRYRIFIETTGRCNLRCRFCAYSKKQLAKTVMPQSMFADVVGQAVNLGFRAVSLTPITGEPFMDKGLLDKLAYLEKNSPMEQVSFFTNLVVPEPEQIAQLSSFTKLHRVSISLYGHDPQSFAAISARDAKLYQRLVRNLGVLLEHAPRSDYQVVIHWRSLPGFSIYQPPNNELQTLVRRFQTELGTPVRQLRMFNNWGGQITSRDVAGLGLPVDDGRHVYKKGICTLPISKVCVLSDGRVNACACRDVNGELILGSLSAHPLAYLLSLANPRYQSLIHEQMQGQFRLTCRSCDYYSSVFCHDPPADVEPSCASLDEALAILGDDHRYQQ